jgi:hypothetical protein
LPRAGAEIPAGVRYMGATMPFRNYLDCEHIEVMRAAFRRVCDVLRLNGNTEDPLTEIIVLKIVKRTKAGETDPERLCIDVLSELEAVPVGGESGERQETPAESA